jgi:hypothetical protein
MQPLRVHVRAQHAPGQDALHVASAFVHITATQRILATADRVLLLMFLFFGRAVQARTVAEPIIATVSLMAESGLPCFSRGAPVANLRRRFHLEMSDAQVGIAVGISGYILS